MSKFTAEDKEKLKKIREEHPDFAKFIDDFRSQFPGSKVTYLKVGDVEFGTPSPPGVTPCLVDVPEQRRVETTTVTIPNSTAGLSVYERAVIEKQKILKGRKR